MAKLTKVLFEGKLVPAEELEFETEREPWTSYKLEDGTIIKFKQAMAKVSRLKETFKPDGDPIYVYEIGAMSHIDIAPGLKKESK